MANYIDYRALKAELPFALVLSHYNTKHSDSKNQDTINCPFHSDGKPSLSINKEKGIFRCFGCNARGNVLSFVCLMEELDENDTNELNQAGQYAVEKILGKTSKDFARPNGQGRGSKSKKPSSRPTEKKEIQPEEPQVKVNKPLSFTLQNLITEHPFIDEHELSADTVETFGLGICGKGMMKDRMVIPIHNSKGKLVAYSGRWLDDNPPEGEGKYKLPKGFNKSIELYNQHRARTLLQSQSEEDLTPLVIVEGFWSVMRLHANGIPTVTTFGADISEEQAYAIARLTEEAIIVFDGDDAGREGALRSAGVLAQHVFTKTVVLPEGEKPDTIDLEFIERAWL